MGHKPGVLCMLGLFACICSVVHKPKQAACELQRSMGEGADPSADSLRNLTVLQLTKVGATCLIVCDRRNLLVRTLQP